MACKKLTRREVIELIFGDSDSEGENLTLRDDGRLISELASRERAAVQLCDAAMFTNYKAYTSHNTRGDRRGRRG